jgi:hypothetical protein
MSHHLKHGNLNIMKQLKVQVFGYAVYFFEWYNQKDFKKKGENI